MTECTSVASKFPINALPREIVDVISMFVCADAEKTLNHHSQLRLRQFCAVAHLLGLAPFGCNASRVSLGEFASSWPLFLRSPVRAMLHNNALHSHRFGFSHLARLSVRVLTSADPSLRITAATTSRAPHFCPLFRGGVPEHTIERTLDALLERVTTDDCVRTGRSSDIRVPSMYSGACDVFHTKVRIAVIKSVLKTSALRSKHTTMHNALNALADAVVFLMLLRFKDQRRFFFANTGTTCWCLFDRFRLAYRSFDSFTLELLFVRILARIKHEQCIPLDLAASKSRESFECLSAALFCLSICSRFSLDVPETLEHLLGIDPLCEDRLTDPALFDCVHEEGASTVFLVMSEHSRQWLAGKRNDFLFSFLGRLATVLPHRLLSRLTRDFGSDQAMFDRNGFVLSRVIHDGIRASREWTPSIRTLTNALNLFANGFEHFDCAHEIFGRRSVLSPNNEFVTPDMSLDFVHFVCSDPCCKGRVSSVPFGLDLSIYALWLSQNYFSPDIVHVALLEGLSVSLDACFNILANCVDDNENLRTIDWDTGFALAFVLAQGISASDNDTAIIDSIRDTLVGLYRLRRSRLEGLSHFRTCIAETIGYWRTEEGRARAPDCRTFGELARLHGAEIMHLIDAPYADAETDDSDTENENVSADFLSLMGSVLLEADVSVASDGA